MAQEEIAALEPREQALEEELKVMLLTKDPNDEKNIILEIRAGTGGDEAALFARDLYEMYKHYAEGMGWKVEIMDASPTELGGFKEMILGLEGEGVFRLLQYESGGHRVQRVPETEAKGRVHTSAATVAVMAEPEDVEIDLKPGQYTIEKMRASGPGGQHVNKTSSAIRLTHLATGIVVSCQDEKSQHKNMAKALRVLKGRLYEAKRQEEHRKRSTERRSKIGSGDRSERIRTYNFPQNRLTDHRVNQNFNLESAIAGNLGPVIDTLVECHRQAERAAFGNLE
jgi:peptide chain release factor 1